MASARPAGASPPSGSSKTPGGSTPRDALQVSSDTQPPKAAEQALARHTSPGSTTSNRENPGISSEIDVADVLAIYHADKIEGQGLRRNEFEARIGRLNSFWGGRALSWVSTATCKEYARVAGRDPNPAGMAQRVRVRDVSWRICAPR